MIRIFLHPQPLGVLHVRVGVDADENILQMRVLAAYVVGVVGGDYGDAQLAVYFVKPLVDLGKLRNVAVPHEFEIVVPENLAVPAGGGDGVVHAPLLYQRRHLPAWAAGHDNQAFMVALQNLAVHARLVVEPLQMRGGDELDQTLIALPILGEDGHVVGRPLVGVALKSALGRDIHLAADDGLDARALGEAVEIYRAVHAAVVGHRQALHAQLAGAVDKRLKAAQPVQHGVFGVYVQMGEHGHSRGGVLSVWRFGRRILSEAAARTHSV